MTELNSFEEFVESQRTAIGEKRSEIESQITALQAELAQFDTELRAIAAYEEAKSGRAKPAQAKSSVPRGTRGPRGRKQGEILELISGHEGGLSRDEILRETGAKGNKPAEQSISNILHTLKKAEKITLEAKRYSVR